MGIQIGIVFSIQHQVLNLKNMNTQKLHNSGFILKKKIMQDVYTRTLTAMLSKTIKSWK